ncbi:MAG TPA: iron chelate uptake ABC transporter family permease subunit, partial [Thermoanaerobacterales bacterium]|nr:iron chelate uptake ABC transporter family permease subunit [Thermoanaerobacterales bacterium]
MGYNRESDNQYKMLLVLIALLILVSIISIGMGTVKISFNNIVNIFSHKLGFFKKEPYWNENYEQIIFDIRLPRTILAGLVGMALSIAGTTYQGIFVNPMADPYIIGASSGASLGASIAIVYSVNFTVLGMSSVPFLAFLGSLSTVMLVYWLARTSGRVPVMTLLLSGIAVTTFISAFVSLLTYFSDHKLHQLVFWMMGGFSSANWTYVKIILPYIIIGSIANLVFARELNIMLLGEETAHHLGVSVEKLKKILLISSSMLTAASVSVSGTIGFVGLVVPHIIRLIVGPDHRILLPASAIFGAVFLIVADIVSR